MRDAGGRARRAGAGALSPHPQQGRAAGAGARRRHGRHDLPRRRPVAGAARRDHAAPARAVRAPARTWRRSSPTARRTAPTRCASSPRPRRRCAAPASPTRSAAFAITALTTYAIGLTFLRASRPAAPVAPADPGRRCAASARRRHGAARRPPPPTRCSRARTAPTPTALFEFGLAPHDRRPGRPTSRATWPSTARRADVRLISAAPLRR